MKDVIECVSPVCPEEMDWSQLYPAHFSQREDTEVKAQVEFADIGCGYGGLLGMNDVNICASDVTIISASENLMISA